MARTRYRSRGVAVVIAICALAACTTPSTTGPTKPSTTATKPKAGAGALGQPSPGAPTNPSALVGPTRTVAEPLVTADFSIQVYRQLSLVKHIPR